MGGGATINQTSINNRAIIFRQCLERACHSIPFSSASAITKREYGYLFNAAADKQNKHPRVGSQPRLLPRADARWLYAGNPTPPTTYGGTLGLLRDYYAFEAKPLFIMLDPLLGTR